MPAKRWIAQVAGILARYQQKLRETADEETHRRLANNPTVAPEVQVKLLANTELHAALARNPAATAVTQRALAKSRALAVRTNLAANPSLTPDVQQYLTRDRSSEVQSNLLRNPAVRARAGQPDEYPPAVPRTGIGDVDTEEADELARAGDPSIGINVQIDLAASRSLSVRLALSYNRSIAPDVQRLLASDHQTRDALAGNPALIPELQVAFCHAYSEFTLQFLAPNEALCPTAMLLLSHHAEARVRRSLAHNPQLPANIFNELCRDAEPEVRSACWYVTRHRIHRHLQEELQQLALHGGAWEQYNDMVSELRWLTEYTEQLDFE